MAENDPFKEKKLQQLQLSIHLIPIFGAIASVWVLNRKTSNPETEAVSRLAVRLTGGWLLAYGRPQHRGNPQPEPGGLVQHLQRWCAQAPGGCRNWRGGVQVTLTGIFSDVSMFSSIASQGLVHRGGRWL
jgi:hypothetical protein